MSQAESGSSRWRIVLVCASLTVLAALLLYISHRDARSRILQVERLMVAEARAISVIIAESSTHGLETYSRWENELNRRLVDNARWIASHDSLHDTDATTLALFAREHGLHRILVYDAEGNLEMTDRGVPGQSSRADSLPNTFLSPLLDGRADVQKLGFRTARRDSALRYVVGVSRPGGGAIVVNVEADSLETARDEMSPGHLIRTLGASHGVRYVVIQNAHGILAASAGVSGFPAPGDDPALHPLTKGAPLVTHEYDSPAGPVFEVSRVISLGKPGDALLRIGLNNDVLEEVRQDIRRRTVIRAVILLFSVLLASSLLMAWQRQATLGKEVNRIELELRAREEEARRAEKLAAMGALASGVAHQVRNPLNSIHLIAQRLGRQADVDDMVREQFGVIQGESARIEAIIQQFLKFASPRQPRLESLPLGETVRNAVATFASAHETSNIDIHQDIADITTTLDRSFVIEIIENLLRNAEQAGAGSVRVSLERRGQDAEIAVTDDGPGIPADMRNRGFDLYFTTRRDGTGLGLSLTAQMVAAMNGTIALDDTVPLEDGARFVIRFPLERRVR